MRVIVCSDSHGRSDLLQKAVNTFAADVLIHLGDHFSDVYNITLPQGMRVECVRGNCDRGGAEEEKVIELEGKKLFLTHGHRYSVKSSLLPLCARMDALGAHIALYGHTHIPGYEFFGRGVILNPGALQGNRTNRRPGFAYLEWKRGGESYIQMSEVEL